MILLFEFSVQPKILKCTSLDVEFRKSTSTKKISIQRILIKLRKISPRVEEIYFKTHQSSKKLIKLHLN